MKEYNRNCPKCNKELIYSGYHSWWVANHDNSKCYSCSSKEKNSGKNAPFLGKHHSVKMKKKMSNMKKGKNHPFYGKHHSEETKLKMRGRIPWNKGKKHSEETIKKIKENRKQPIFTNEYRYKLRKSMVDKVKKYGIHARSFNPKACNFINNLNKLLKINLQHALNGGEYSCDGYFVDGYDKEKNIIFEYDEPRHHTSKYRERDEIKQKSILENIKPSSFIRYDEKDDRLYDVISNKDIKITE